MKDEIFRSIKEYADLNPLRWHTPGHKGLLSRFDVTEIDDSFPSDSIERAQKRVAEIYGVKAVRFLTGGSSMGIKAGLMSLPGDVLIESASHQAVREGLKLAGKKAVEITNITKNGLPIPLSLEQIEDVLIKNPNIRTVVITSPDYYGQTVNASEIFECVKKRGVYLYVDSAHGAHFAYRKDLFPKEHIHLGDIFNISAHKTLPAFTQSAYLCINNENLISKIDENLTLLGTTSPSYLLLAGLEFAANYCQKNASYYDTLAKSCKYFRENIRCLKNDDFSRIVIDAEYYGINGKTLYFALKEKGVIAEKYDDRYVVFIVTIMDNEDNITALKDSVLSVLTKHKEQI